MPIIIRLIIVSERLRFNSIGTLLHCTGTHQSVGRVRYCISVKCNQNDLGIWPLSRTQYLYALDTKTAIIPSSPIIKIHYCAFAGRGGAVGTTLQHSYLKTVQMIINCPPFRSRATLRGRFSSIFHNMPLRLVYELIAVGIIIVIVAAWHRLYFYYTCRLQAMQNSRNTTRFEKWSITDGNLG